MHSRLFIHKKVEGLENVPKTGGMVIVPNRIGNYDPIVIAACLKRQVTFMAPEVIFKVNTVGFLLKILKVIPIFTGNKYKNTINEAVGLLKKGWVVLTYSEAKPNKSYIPVKIRDEASVISAKSGSPIVPVAIYWDNKRANITFCKPISADNDIKKTGEITKAIEKAIEEKLNIFTGNTNAI